MDDRLPSIRALLEEAGAVALAGFGQLEGRRKGDDTLVTEADTQAESILVAGLQALFPLDTIVGEEGAHVVGGPRTWFMARGPTWKACPTGGRRWAWSTRMGPCWGPSICHGCANTGWARGVEGPLGMVGLWHRLGWRPRVVTLWSMCPRVFIDGAGSTFRASVATWAAWQHMSPWSRPERLWPRLCLQDGGLGMSQGLSAC